MPKRNTPEPVEPEPTAEPEEPATPAAEAEAEEPEFLNRAARRAHGKGKDATPQAQQKGHFPQGQSTRQGPRMWGNRRSG
jgi:hypothetical protein